MEEKSEGGIPGVCVDCLQTSVTGSARISARFLPPGRPAFFHPEGKLFGLGGKNQGQGLPRYGVYFAALGGNIIGLDEAGTELDLQNEKSQAVDGNSSGRGRD